MPIAALPNGINLEYETFGRDDAPTLLLVMGLGAQMVAWEAEFCELLAGEGFHVVRYDNRDVGGSSRVTGGERIDVTAAMVAAFSGQPVEAPYLIGDMAQDAVHLLDHLGVERAHVVGASMGGMIAQALAIDHPERLCSVTSIMSTTGDPTVGLPTQEAIEALMRPRARSKEEYVALAVESERLLNGPVIPFDEERSARRAALTWDRGYDPAGFSRQFLAVLASPDRTEGLRQVDVPFLVIHGGIDPLVDRSGGEATARAVPVADLVVIDDMGHNLPAIRWQEVAELIVDHARKAE